MNETIQTAAPAPCTFISTSFHYKASGKHQRCRDKEKKETRLLLLDKRDPMYKLFDVVSLFGHSIYVHYFLSF